MRIDPAIAALRADPGLQRQAQAATIASCAAWSAEPAAAAALAELERFGAGAPLEACASLEAMFTEAAGELVGSLCARMSETLTAGPFGHPLFRHGFDGSASTLLLARAGRAQLILHAREPGAYEFARGSFSHAVRFEAVLAGEAQARIVRRLPAGFAHERISLRAGARLALDLSSEVLQLVEVSRRLVSLRLHRFAAEPQPTRDYSLENGKLLHQSSGDLASSRREMMLAVLGRMKCAHAAPVMAAMAREPGEASQRWQALRECLALDTATGFRALLAVARAPDDPLSAAAGALRGQLVEAHPQLLALEEHECPA
jgi:hypothetical protein